MVEQRNNPEVPMSTNFSNSVLSKADQDILNMRLSTAYSFELESAPVRSAVVDHESLVKVLDGLQSQIARVREQVDVIKEEKFDGK